MFLILGKLCKQLTKDYLLKHPASVVIVSATYLLIISSPHAFLVCLLQDPISLRFNSNSIHRFDIKWSVSWIDAVLTLHDIRGDLWRLTRW